MSVVFEAVGKPMLNIEKGQSLSLVKPDGTSIQKIRVGLAWDMMSWRLEQSLYCL
jgi:stress response protein SCP2